MKLATYQKLGYSLTAPIAFFACKNLYGQITNGRYKFKAILKAIHFLKYIFIYIER